MTKLSASVKKAKERAKQFSRITKTMQLKRAISLYGLNEVIWAMNRFVRKQKELKRLGKQERQLKRELVEVQMRIG